MAHRSPARWLAPLALVAFLLAFVVVVGSSGGGNGETEPANETAPAAESGSGTAAEEGEEGEGGRSRKTYTVKLGDTPSGIASENDITVEQLLRLNPDLDPQLLSPGEKIRIRK